MSKQVSLALDHLFICVDENAPESELLQAAGFLEGSANQHLGQGTANRRFFFENLMLELLWVNDATAAQSETTQRTQLWPRWQQRQSNTVSPFGIGLDSGGLSAEALPFATWAYHPRYLPPELSLAIAETKSLAEPMVFSFPFAHFAKPNTEPRQHIHGLTHIVRVEMTVTQAIHTSSILPSLTTSPTLHFQQGTTPLLHLYFAAPTTNLPVTYFDFRPALPLVFSVITC